MADFITILILGVIQLLVGSIITSNTPMVFGNRIPQSKFKTLQGARILKNVRFSLFLSGGITLVGGFSCKIFYYHQSLSLFLFFPIAIAGLYILTQLYAIQKDKKWGFFLFTISIGVLFITSIEIFLPSYGNKTNIILRNDTLCITGVYPQKIPFSEITKIEYKSTPPAIMLRTNGIAAGALKIGYFRTKDNRDILLYIYSDTLPVIHIKNNKCEDIYINFPDSTKSIKFFTELKNCIYKK